MARRAHAPMTVAELTAEIDELLRSFQAEAGGLSLREKVLRLVELQRDVRRLNVAVAAQEGLSPTSATDRLRCYLLRYPATVIDSTELELGAGDRNGNASITAMC